MTKYEDCSGKAVRMSDLVHELPSGRWIVAEWSERQSQWQSTNLPEPEQGYVKSYARTLPALANIGIRTYASRPAAVRAAVRLYDLETVETEPKALRSIRMSDAEWKRVGELAEQAGLDVSSYIRGKVL